MNKMTRVWTVSELLDRYSRISFPEYQRESTVWNRRAKQRLIDSMLRQFDIASLYFYEQDATSLECIDGRQRIAAIMSFFGVNDQDETDNNFPLRLSNEVYEDEAFKYRSLDGLTHAELAELHPQEDNGECLATELLETLRQYELTIVLEGMYLS